VKVPKLLLAPAIWGFDRSPPCQAVYFGEEGAGYFREGRCAFAKAMSALMGWYHGGLTRRGPCTFEEAIWLLNPYCSEV
jgi:hypothetical protein